MERPVYRPDYYCDRKHEPKDVIRDWKLNFNLGNVLKYIARCGKKANEALLKYLKKARQYLNFEIEYLEQQELLALVMQNEAGKEGEIETLR